MALLAHPPVVDPRALAPDAAYFVETLEAAERSILEADALRTAVARTHNRWAQRSAALGSLPCTDAEAASLAARSQRLGQGYRDAVQSARADAARLTRALASPTLAPLATATDRRRADRVLERSRAHARDYGELSAWQAKYLENFRRKCAPPLLAAPGLPSSSVRAMNEAEERIAVIGIGGGRVCPLDRPADG